MQFALFSGGLENIWKSNPSADLCDEASFDLVVTGVCLFLNRGEIRLTLHSGCFS